MSVYDLLPGVSTAIQASVLTAVILLVAGMNLRSQLESPDAVLPDEGITIRNLFEGLLNFLVGLAETTMGEHWRKYFPIAGTIFFFVFVTNLLGLIPGLGGATSNVNTCWAWAVIAYLTYNFVGIREHGWKYVYHLMGPSLWEPEIGGEKWHVRLLAPVFLPLEFVLHLARIATLAIRLAANIFADHAVIKVWLGLIPLFVPAVFMGLGLIVSFMQAFVFSLLTMIYIGEALEEAH